VRRIAISYRRVDSAAIVGRIFENLDRHFDAGEVFMDIDAIPYGEDFRDVIAATLEQARVVVLVIGKKWLGGLRHGQSRIMEPTDPVRAEIETALRLNLRIIPVLVEGAAMPNPSDLPESLQRLPFLNAMTVDSGRDFRPHIVRLVHVLEGVLGVPIGSTAGSVTGSEGASVISRASDGDGVAAGLANEAAEATASTTPHNLPLLLTTFCGRENDLDALEAQLRDHRLVTLVGFGGVGKTRTAIEAGWHLLGDFPDGVFLVELAPLADPQLVAARIAVALGVPAQTGQLSGDLWLDSLREKRALLVLDNCEHVLDAAGEIVHRLLQRCPNFRVLATSRESLRIPGERLLRLEPLPVKARAHDGVALHSIHDAPAALLFLDRVSNIAPSFASARMNRRWTISGPSWLGRSKSAVMCCWALESCATSNASSNGSLSTRKY
jgi:hypothetical protein